MYDVNVISALAQCFLKTVIFQQIRMETDQVKMIFATTLDEMYPVGLCLHILPDVLLHVVAGSWSGLHAYAWERSVFYECFQACWISQQKVEESAGSLNLQRYRLMRATVIKTAVKMPFYSISYSSSSYSASSSVFRDTEKLSCANEVSAS